MKPMDYVVRSIPFCLILALGFVGFFSLMSLRKPPATIESQQLAPVIETIPVRDGGRSLRLEADGEVVPFKQVSLSAQVAGRIHTKDAACRAGHYVEAGQLLLQIDSRDYDLEIRRTQELLRQTEVSIEELDVEAVNTQQLVKLAEQDRDLQEREVLRYEQLMKQQAASQAALDNARRGRIQANNALQSQQNQLRLLATRRGRLLSDKERLAVQLEQAILDRSRCDVTAPISGVIVADPVEQDDFVQPGTMVVQLEDTERLEVRFNLKLDQLRWIWSSSGRAGDPLEAARASFDLPDLPVSILMDAEGGVYVWEGHLSRYDDAGLNPVTRTVPCIATVDNPRGADWRATFDDPADSSAALVAPPSLLRGMFVRVEFDVPLRQELLAIPVAALRPGNRIWLEEHGKLAVHKIRVAQARGDQVAFFPTPNVQVGASLIITPLSLGINGMDVRREERTMTVADRESSSDRSLDGAADGKERSQ